MAGWGAVQRDRECVGRPQLVERQRGAEGWVSGKSTHVDSFAGQKSPYVPTLAVLANCRYDRSRHTQPCQSGTHVSVESANAPAERLDLLQRTLSLKGIEVEAHPADDVDAAFRGARGSKLVHQVHTLLTERCAGGATPRRLRRAAALGIDDLKASSGDGVALAPS